MLMAALIALERILADPRLRSAFRAQVHTPRRLPRKPLARESTDVFERRLAEQALAESEARLRVLVDNAPVILFALDQDGVFILSEGKDLARLGLEPGRVVGTSVFDLYRDYPVIVDNLRRTLAGEARNFVAEVGELVFDTRTLPFHDDDGAIVGLIGVATDVSDKRRAEDALRASEAKFHAAFHASPDGISIADMDGTFLEVNEGFCRMFGFAREEMIDRSSDELGLWVDPADREEMIDCLRRHGTIRPTEWPMRTRTGRRISAQISAALIELEGRPCILAVSRDVTEQRQIEAALRASEAKFYTAFRASPDAMVISHLGDGRVIEINDGFTRVFGHTRQQALGRTSLELGLWTEPRDRARFVALLQEEGRVRELELPFGTRDGEVRTGLLSAELIEIDGEPHVLTVVRDVTERKRAAEALRASEARFATAFRASPDALVLSTLPDGVFLDVNQGFTRIIGYDREEAIGRTTTELGLWTEPEDRQRMLAALRQAGKVTDMETAFRAKDGVVHPCQLSAEVIEIDGQEVLLSVVRDVTERKRAEEERERFVEELEAKNAELERFTYTVSHDLKSPLITIRGFLGLLERDVEAGDRARIQRDVAQVRNATATMQRLLDELLELSRIGRQVNPYQTIDLGRLVREAVELVGGRLEERRVEVAIGDLPAVRGDRQRLLEVFQNLIDNAAKFMGRQEAPRIDVGGREEGGEVVCWVRDNGIGIEPRYHDKVFGLFDRLDPRSEGTGIGLALVKRIVEVHGGRVWIESAGAQRGTTFYVALPRRPLEPAAAS